jgi:hypothetical protein
MYGKLPKIISSTIVKDNVSKYYLYLPIKMKESKDIRVYKSLEPYLNLVELVENDICLVDKYVYLSVEVGPIKFGVTQKREGWHSDGFLSDDINYLWYDQVPTTFNKTKFIVPDDHIKSMECFNEQALDINNVYYPINTLLKVDQYCIHKATIPNESLHQRTFVKISVSNHKYNLKGNSHNDLFNYNWKMYDRKLVRNHPIYKESDFIE